MMDGYPELKDFVEKHLSEKIMEGLKKLSEIKGEEKG